MRRRQGFSLIEAAIVLGIIGLVIGGIWVAAAAVIENKRFGDAQIGMLQIIDGLRQAYNNRAIANGTDLTALVATGKIAPQNWIKTATTLADPWGGAVQVGMDSSSGAFCSAAPDKWHFTFADVDNRTCTKLLMTPPPGVIYGTSCDTDGCSCSGVQGLVYTCNLPGITRHTVILFFPR